MGILDIMRKTVQARTVLSAAKIIRESTDFVTFAPHQREAVADSVELMGSWLSDTAHAELQEWGEQQQANREEKRNGSDT